MTTKPTEASSSTESQHAVGSQVARGVRPRAWAIFVDNHNARMWSTFQPHVQKLADAEGLEVTLLYDQAAIDAAVAAERERCAKAVRDQLRNDGQQDNAPLMNALAAIRRA